MAAMMAQTITIMDKSNKVVGTSRQLKNVFKEAKLAYQERKAEIAAERKERDDHELRKAIKAMSVADETRSVNSRSSSRPRSHRHESHGGREQESRTRPSHEHKYSSNSIRSDRSDRRASGSSSARHSPPHSPLSHHVSSHTSPYVENEREHNYHSSARSAISHVDPSNNGLIRRRTDLDLATLDRPPRPLLRTNSSPVVDHNIDMDLAYGDFHPDSITPVSPVSPRGLALQKSTVNKEELSSLVLKCKMLLEEANCAQHSVKAVMAHLQSNPDAMAAVALTLAEISNIATKMAPGALMGLKAAAPTVFALLAAPEFLIAVGVSAGITIIMFGGYKIIKKIKAARAATSENDLALAPSGGVDEMIDVEELSRIDQWRRGIADDAFGDDTSSVAGSVATSVEGEFISPFAERSMGHLPLPPKSEGRRERKDREKGEKKDRKDREKGEKKERRRRSGSDKSSVASSRAGGSESGKALVRVKKPSPLRRMFNSGSTDRGTSVAS